MKATNMGTARRVADRFYDATVALSYGAPGYQLRAKAFVDPDIAVDLSGKIIVVTGANAGLGYEIAKGIVARGGTCALVCRNPEKAERAREALAQRSSKNGGAPTVFLGDLSSIAETNAVADALLERFGAIDCLVNNAGVLLDGRYPSVDGFEMAYATNVLSGFILTERLRPALKRAKAPRVIQVTSGGMYSAKLSVNKMRDPAPYDGVEQYARTKRAQVVLNEMWTPVLAEDNIVTTAMHPGWADTPGVQTSLPRFQKLLAPLLRSPAQGADTALWLAATDDLSLDDSGKLWFDREPRRTHYMKSTVETSEQRIKLWNTVASDSGLDLPSPE